MSTSVASVLSFCRFLFFSSVIAARVKAGILRANFVHRERAVPFAINRIYIIITMEIVGE